jgi:hypothetical protein
MTAGFFAFQQSKQTFPFFTRLARKYEQQPFFGVVIVIVVVVVETLKTSTGGAFMHRSPHDVQRNMELCKKKKEIRKINL